MAEDARQTAMGRLKSSLRASIGLIVLLGLTTGVPALWGFLLQDLTVFAGGLLTTVVWVLLFEVRWVWAPLWKVKGDRTGEPRLTIELGKGLATPPEASCSRGMGNA